jgi:hypothetical protein
VLNLVNIETSIGALEGIYLSMVIFLTMIDLILNIVRSNLHPLSA